jgi:uncharacterized membrane protein
MKSKAEPASHPAQPNLVVFPLGPLVTSIIFDGVNLVKDRPEMAQVSYWATTLGLIASLVVTIPALTDCFAIPVYTRAKRITLLHGVGNVLVLALLGISWCWRTDELGYQPTVLVLVSSGMAFMLLSLTGWLDDKLIDRLEGCWQRYAPERGLTSRP